jgi:hypothetical protein
MVAKVKLDGFLAASNRQNRPEGLWREPTAQAMLLAAPIHRKVREK